MVLDPSLAVFRTELERLGYVVVPHGDHICVRLPLFASVRIWLREGAVLCEPWFGPFKRARALPLGMTAVLAVVAALFYSVGIGPLTLGIAFGGILAVVSDVCRLVLTESCVTRVQLLWASRSLAGAREPVLGAAGPGGRLLGHVPNEDQPPARAVSAVTRSSSGDDISSRRQVLGS